MACCVVRCAAFLVCMCAPESSISHRYTQHQAQSAAVPDEVASHPDVVQLQTEITRREQRAKKLRGELDTLLSQKADVMQELERLRAEQEHAVMESEDRAQVCVVSCLLSLRVCVCVCVLLLLLLLLLCVDTFLSLCV